MEKQAEKNKEILLGEMEKYSEKPISPAAAKYLADCWGAYKAICMAEKHHSGEIGSEHKDSANQEEKLSPSQIKKWMDCLENEDGTAGPHYTKEQVDQYRRGLGIECDLMELYAAANMMYPALCQHTAFDRFFMTSSAMIRPTTGGRNTLLPGICRHWVHSRKIQRVRQMILISSIGVSGSSLE